MTQSFLFPYRTLTNQIDISNVNDALKPATKEQTKKDIFSYNVNDNDMDKKDTPLLKDEEQTTYTDQFTTGDTLDITETGLTNDGRVLKDLYTTSWDLNDEKEQISNSENRDDYVTSDDRSKKDGTFLFQNQSDAPTTNLTVNYYNKVLVGDLVIGKDLTDDAQYERLKKFCRDKKTGRVRTSKMQENIMDIFNSNKKVKN